MHVYIASNFCFAPIFRAAIFASVPATEKDGFVHRRNVYLNIKETS